MTITSTASSGGGLPDVGVFRNEKVYTVYLDMQAGDGDRAVQDLREAGVEVVD